ncbi:(2Fe-2S) ferredoxin domain-containing protein [Clostridium formicaceticum]|uniref:Ferredoxin n=1 Tax=Clostridium formicaceticum TaxID=1497 RepID=A0A1D9FH95_9CLOT|nr:(2Fe-2S) ferredoxin domain-containing protein [Clostridium formicaceticum]AOY74793.1 ferredoxin [Clostridium formicaceticum]AOY74797.1 ferredoxin [Clostridium formicaceticum]ARE89183.1 NADP-reducing hydrogenase subunit HndB [Clostridium formicaceticum]ARE89187.1 NADP-reducing hydrogenase subunit HndB [Clostridium formicaceticum]
MKTIAELQKIRQETLEKVNLRQDRKGTRIVVGMATCGIAAGARPVMMALIEEVNKRNLQDVVVTQTGCIGACRLEPIVEVYKEGEEKVTYVAMTEERARKIIADHIVNGNVVYDYTIGAYEK